MDIRMPQLNGIEATRRVVEHFVRGRPRAVADLDQLTDREREVLALVVRAIERTQSSTDTRPAWSVPATAWLPVRRPAKPAKYRNRPTARLGGPDSQPRRGTARQLPGP
jgi:hypothetical protein